MNRHYVKETQPGVSIVIVTRNREDELWIALESCFAQNYSPLEVLVYEDASERSVGAELKQRFPEAHLHIDETPRGPVHYRERGFHEARGRYVLWLDDDAYYTKNNTISQVVEQFEANPELGAIGLPFVEPFRPARHRTMQSRTNSVSPFRLCSVVGCAAAFHREAVLAAGGLREFFYYYGEERDLTIRLIQAGYDIEYASTAPVVHCYSPKRSSHDQNRYAVRNTLLFDYLNIPQPFMLPRLVWHALRLFVFDLRWSNIFRRIYYIGSGLGGCVYFSRLRKPVDRTIYAKYCRLPAHGAQAWTRGDDVPHPCRRACTANQRP